MDMDTLSWFQIIAAMAGRFLPVWVALVVTYTLSISFKRRLVFLGDIFFHWNNYTVVWLFGQKLRPVSK